MVDSNRMMPDKLHFPRGAAADAADPVLITADASGWARCGLRVVRLEAAQSRTFLSAEDEICVLPLAGGCSVHVDRQELVLDGRESPFARVTDWAYIPIHTSFQITSVAGCELALASARATRKFDAVRIAAEDVPVEIRGAGAATRQVNNFMVPGVFDRADRLICCELLTPDGKG